jgi:acyl dehydratase
MTASERPGGGVRLYFDDLQVGQRFRSGSHALDEAQIRAFARKFDPQPFHLDDEVAKTTMFGGLVASGWHTASITMRLLVEGGTPIAAIIGAGARSVGLDRRAQATSCRSKAKSWR